MIPKFRAWLKYEGCFADSIESIRYDKETVFLKWGGFGKGDRFEFYEVELMQSTGLFDKNGKEIFEGDIVDYKGRKALVSWHGSYASFIYRFVDESHKRNAEWKPLYLAYMRCEIIGNVYENKELLEENK